MQVAPSLFPQERNAYQRAWRRNNAERIREYRKRHRERHPDAANLARQRRASRCQRLVKRLKGIHGCSWCGGHFHPAALDFHHLDAATKTDGVGEIASKGSYAALKTEIRKCVLLCANCHRTHEALIREESQVPHG